MSHSKQIDSRNRALFVFLIDQSGSTSANFGNTGEKMQDAIANVVNEIVHGLVEKGAGGEQYKCRYDFACIGYNDVVGSAFTGTLSGSEIWTSKELYESDLAGEYIVSNSSGGTNMFEAFTRAKEVVEGWILDGGHVNSFPPMIFNITDGEDFTGKDPQTVTDKIKDLKTDDGEVLVWNIHVSPSANDDAATVNLLSDDGHLTHPMAKKLFAMSSVLPSGGVFKEYAGKRAFAYRLNAQQLNKMLAIGTLG